MTWTSTKTRGIWSSIYQVFNWTVLVMSYLNTHLVKLISTLLRIFDSININILRMLFWLNLRKMKADWRFFFFALSRWWRRKTENYQVSQHKAQHKCNLQNKGTKTESPMNEPWTGKPSWADSSSSETSNIRNVTFLFGLGGTMTRLFLICCCFSSRFCSRNRRTAAIWTSVCLGRRLLSISKTPLELLMSCYCLGLETSDESWIKCWRKGVSISDDVQLHHLTWAGKLLCHMKEFRFAVSPFPSIFSHMI